MSYTYIGHPARRVLGDSVATAQKFSAGIRMIKETENWQLATAMRELQLPRLRSNNSDRRNKANGHIDVPEQQGFEADDVRDRGGERSQSSGKGRGGYRPVAVG